MARDRKNRQESSDSSLVVVYARLFPEDYEELKRREAKTGAPMAAQIRILVREALRQHKRVQ